MNIRQRHRASTEFSLASISDIVFLLLIFFMITSSFVQPGVKVDLPQGSSERPSQGMNTVTVNEDGKFFWNSKEMQKEQLAEAIKNAIETATAKNDKNSRVITLRTDKQTIMQDAAFVISEVARNGGAVVIATKKN